MDTYTIVCSLLQAILAGDFILSAASMALARIGNNAVVKVLSQVIEDLVRGTVYHSNNSCQFALCTLQATSGRRESNYLILLLSQYQLRFQVSSCSWDPKRTRTKDSNTTSRKPSRRLRVLLQTVVKQYVRSVSTQISQSW